MTENEARSHLENMRTALLQLRASFDATGPTGEMKAILHQEWPWLFGDRCPLPALDRALAPTSILPVDYYNLMTILWRFLPEVVTIMSDLGLLTPPLPPDVSVFKGWTD